MFADQADRDRFVAAHADLVARARAAPGCLDIAISADVLDRRRANNYERWEDVERSTGGGSRRTRPTSAT